jgi:hypothetical protein
VSRVDRRRIGLLVFCALAVVTSLAVVDARQKSGGTQQKWPPQFPREGATKLFENDQIIVWEQVGRPKTPFVHKHIRDILTFAVEPGRVDVLGPDLKPIASSSTTGATQRLYPGERGGLTFTKAGLGPHVEVSPDPAKIPKSLFVEIKGTEPKDCAQWSTACK